VGAPLAGRVLIIDDVITAGTSIRESVELIRAAGASPCGVVIALDRMERGNGALSAVQEVEQDYGIPVLAVATLDDLLGFLQQSPDFRQSAAAVAAIGRNMVLRVAASCCLFLLALARRQVELSRPPQSSVAMMPPASRCVVTFCRRRVMGAPIASWVIPAGVADVEAPLTAEQRAKRAAEEQRVRSRNGRSTSSGARIRPCSIPMAAKRISRPCAAAPSGTWPCAIKAAEERIIEIRRQRKKFEDEAEFYNNRQLPVDVAKGCATPITRSRRRSR
jgi:hypothetical protein